MSTKEYVLEKIINARVNNDPWDHVVIKNFLPKSFYENLVKETEEYTKREELKQSNIRAYHIYVNKSISLFPNSPFLKEYYNILLDKDISEAIESKLSIIISPKDFYSELNLFTQGYNYGEIHPDRSDKTITMLHYLADDGDDFKTNHCMVNKSKTTFLRKSFQTFWIKETSDWTKDKQSGRIKL